MCNKDIFMDWKAASYSCSESRTFSVSLFLYQFDNSSQALLPTNLVLFKFKIVDNVERHRLNLTFCACGAVWFLIRRNSFQSWCLWQKSFSIDLTRRLKIVIPTLKDMETLHSPCKVLINVRPRRAAVKGKNSNTFKYK